MNPRQHRTRSEKHEQHDSEIHGGENAGFHLPPVVDDSADRCQINQLVQAIPALAAKFADSPRRRCGSKRDKQRVGEEACDDKAALGDVRFENAHVEVEIQDQVRRQVNRRVEKSEKSEQPAELDEPGETRREQPKRRDGER